MRRLVTGALVVSLSLGLAAATSPVRADEPAGVDPRQYDEVVSKAINYLITKGQAEDGSFTAQAGPAVTSLVATALMRNGLAPEHPAVAKALRYVEQFQQKDGGIYPENSLYKNYETSTSVLCFKEANRNGKYDRLLAGADAFLKGIQWDEEEGKDKSDFAYGGAGYGSHARPDLSNTAFFIEALRATGNAPDSEAIQRALLFVSRSQNLETEHNTTPFAAKNPDGGFYYTPAAGGSSQAGETPEGGLRSYGSMTYAGLKSMIFAGVDAKDPRVQAAVKWIARHYDLTANPGLGDAGLYYYYHTFAKALDAMEQDVFTDAAGQKHNWRAELVAELARRQADDGSFLNENSRWLEGEQNLVTGYALLALSYCKPAAE